MYFHTWNQAGNTLVAILACGFALWRGGKPERLAAGLILLDWMITPLLQNQGNLTHIQISNFCLDGALTLALGGIALSSNRFWPIWVTAFQILELLMHVAMLADHRVRPIAYFIGTELASYLILLALVIGTWLEGPHSTRRAP
jgi:hypothetical protein